MLCDVSGREIKVGSFFVYAAKFGQSVELKYGLVRRVKERHDDISGKDIKSIRAITVERRWDGWVGNNSNNGSMYRWILQADGKEITLLRAECGVLMVPSELVPEEALKILNGFVNLDDVGV